MLRVIVHIIFTFEPSVLCEQIVTKLLKESDQFVCSDSNLRSPLRIFIYSTTIQTNITFILTAHGIVILAGIYSVSSGVGQFTVSVASERRRGLQLRGDILIKCYHRGDIGRETIFACQFHTCAVADYTLSFTRQELDNACNGKICRRHIVDSNRLS